MRRRDFIRLAGAASAAAALPRVALAQQARVPRVAFLGPTNDPEWIAAFTQGMAEQGYVNGKNVTFEFFFSNGTSNLPALAANAVASRPDVIFAVTTAAALAAKNATDTIPVVFALAADPIASGLVASLAHPGGNMTGRSDMLPDVIGKDLAILKELVPSLTRIAVLNVPGLPIAALYRAPVEAAAKALAIEPVFIDFVDGQDFAGQFERVVASGAQAVFVPAFAYWSPVHDRLFDLLLSNRLPALSPEYYGDATPFFGVVNYGPNQLDTIRRTTSYVGAILKGAKPADLPVEQPTVFDFRLNLDMARKIGVTIPPSIFAQATLVIDYDLRAPH